LVVFSDIYYDKGWNAYIDETLASYVRVNYVLRGMIIPSGSHTIEFKFEPASYGNSSKIALSSSLLFILAMVGMIIYEGIKAKGLNPADE
jgi:uncharacterized membrane protein YfhO